jgi:hypothetical protein
VSSWASAGRDTEQTVSATTTYDRLGITGYLHDDGA